MKAFPALFLAFLLITSMISSAQEKTVTYLWDPSYEIRDNEIEIHHMKADLKILPFDTLVIGEVLFKFKTLRENIDSIVFEVPELQIHRVEIDGNQAEIQSDGTLVKIFPPGVLGWHTEHEILFIYEARPTEGLYFVGWNDPRQIKRKQIWAHRPGHWLPYHEAIQTVEMFVTVPGDLKVFSNGVREFVVTNKDDTKTWHYRMHHPHPFFSTCLVIGDYNYKTLETSGGLPVELWYYPDWEDHFDDTYKYQPEMFDFFEAEFGFKYPWELYRQAPVIDYMYGAMETTTSTIFGDYLMVDERGFLGRNYVNVNAHELAHQWFGNYISHLKTKDVWLTESFATYWAKKFEQHMFGDDYYQDVRNTELLDTYAAARSNDYPVGHSRGGRARFYPKGSLVMDMLRDILGDKEFKAVMQYYLENHPFETAETNDFLQAIRKVTGRSMEWFFEQWIYRGGEPVYRINYEELYQDQQKQTRIRIAQIHETGNLTGLFSMPVDVEVYYTDGTKDRKTQWIDQQEELVVVPNPEEKDVDFVVFDPNRKIIKSVVFDRSYDELIAQALKAENMIDRYDALLALREFPLQKKREDLIGIYNRESYHLTKGEVISQLSSGLDEDVTGLIRRAVSDEDDKVRLAVLRNVRAVPESIRPEYESLLHDKSYLNVELALENLCRSFPNRYHLYLDRTADETGWRGRNIRIKWLELAIENGGTLNITELKQYASQSYEFETRINAMHALKRLNLLDEELVTFLIDGYFHWNYKIRNAAGESLRYYSTQNEYLAMIRKVINTGTYSATEKEKLEVLLADS